MQVFDPLTKAGFTWFTVNYRLAPQFRYPAAIDDAVTAIKYVQAHAAEYKVDKKRLAIAGESAGGHIVFHDRGRVGPLSCTSRPWFRSISHNRHGSCDGRQRPE